MSTYKGYTLNLEYNEDNLKYRKRILDLYN
jgi:hypothetical protein